MARFRCALATTALFASLIAPSRGVSAEPDGGSAAAATPEETVRAEPVYVSGLRPRADGAVQASVADEELARWNAGGCSDPRFVSNRPGFHVAPRVKVDVQARRGLLSVRSSQKGVLSETAVLAQTRSHGYWPFRLCFEAGLRNGGKLKGKTRLSVVVASNGQVHSARVVATELADPEAASCLAARARQLKFSPPPPRRLGMEVLVDLSPGDAPLPGVGLATGAAAEAGPPQMDAHALDTLLASAAATAGTCFAAMRLGDSGLWGRLGLRVDVDRHQNVTVREYESRFPAPEVVRCTTAAVQALPLGSAVVGPASFTWGLRFGSPAKPSTGTPIQAENKASGSAANSAVAESPAPRVRVAP